MLRLRLQFVLGRYYASPWGRHPIEGACEWPPSPWRVQRALLAAWYRVHDEEPGETMARLLGQLSLQPPSFCVPPFSYGHSRHYVPVGNGRKLQVEAFIAIEPEDSTYIEWSQAELGPEEEALLDRLLQRITYLGRSESRCLLHRVPDSPPCNVRPNEPEDEGFGDLTTLLCTRPEVEVDQVAASTRFLRSKGYSQPPGSRWVTYRFLASKAAPPHPRIEARPALIALAVHCKEAIARHELLPFADRIRRRLLALGANSSTLLGKAQDGQPRKGPHQHLHILPEGPTETDAIERVLLWASEGFGRVDRHILGMLRFLPPERGQRAVHLSLLDATLAVQSGAHHTWLSYSPFLLTRHPKKDGRDSLEEQVRKECESRGLPAPEVLRMPAPLGKAYKLHRGPRQRSPGDPEWLSLTFPQPISGPLCLGAQSHFGMGRFIPSS